jgi:hypothetical protein
MLSVSTGEIPGGWVTFPGGSFERDPASNLPRAGSPENLSYDRAFNRWILASWNYISPDGRRYVTQGLNGDPKIVDVATGAERQIVMPQVRGMWSVIDYNAAGIYLTLSAGLDYADPGLWLLNPDSGHVRQLDATQFWSQVDSRAAWGVKPAAGTLLLQRFDLQTGTLSTELAVPYHAPLQAGDRLLELISLDAQGRPLILERDWQHTYPWHLALVIAPATVQDIPIPDEWAAGWPLFDNGDPFQASRELHGLPLSTGIWMFGFHSFPGLALLTPGGALRQLTSAPDNIWAIAGGCH